MAFEDYYRKRRGEEAIAEQPQQAAQTEAKPQPEIAGIPAPVEKPKKSTVDMSWWQSPHYAQAEQALQQQAQATMQQQERRALNERRAALLGDIARLGAQTWAKSGGAWMIPKTESQTAAANNRLQQLRDKHAADMLAYSQRLQQARLADKQDQMRKEQTRQAIAKEQAATVAAAQQQAFDNAVTMQKMQNEREANVAKMAIDVQKMQNDAAYRQGMVDAAKRRAEAYEQYVTNGGRKSTNKTLTFVSPDNERYDISENVYNASIGELYSMICEDLDIPTNQSGEIDASANKRLQRILGIEKSILGGSRTETMKNVVSALWKDSPRAKEYLKLLSEASRQGQGQQADDKADIWDDTEDDTIELDNI
jgi:hypothetical protein